MKEIKLEDSVECYVDNDKIPTKNNKKTFIYTKTKSGLYCCITGDYYKYAIPCKYLDGPKWSDKYPAEWSIHAKIFKALNDGAIIRLKHISYLKNYWNSENKPSEYEICTNYTGTDLDFWENIKD